MALTDGFQALGQEINKTSGQETKDKEGLSKEAPELALDMQDDELIKLAEKWETDWAPYKQEWEKKYKKNEKYWKGDQYSEAEMKNGSTVDNVVFEAVETLLPATTSRNPEPLVSAENTDIGKALERDVQGMLVHHADRLRLKKRIKKVARHWMLYLQGCMKMGWSMKNNDISSPVIHPTKLILDPDATIDDDLNYTGAYIGELLEDTASNLIQRFPSKKEDILKEANQKTGSKIKYTEWWTDDYMFWKMKKVVLDKVKNPHWNEDSVKDITDEFGNVTQQLVPAVNHFNSKEKPYVFLSVYSLGKHPHDDTGLIKQVSSMQDVVNKRQKQIDKNVEDMNAGWIISMERAGMTKEQAAQAVDAICKGGAIVAPTGAAQDVAHRVVGTGLPPDVFANLKDTRDEIKNVFGVSGSNPSGIKGDRTVEGKRLVRMQDESRNGTLIDALEQFADKTFNWWVQLMYVHYDEAHTASIIGSDKAKEYITLSQDTLNRKVTVTVKEGSLLPRDPVSDKEDAIELYKEQAIDPITLFDKMGFPDPIGSAKKLWIWQNDPTSFFANDPQVQQIQQNQQLAAQQAEIKQAHIADQAHQNNIEEIAASQVVKSSVNKEAPKPGLTKNRFNLTK